MTSVKAMSAEAMSAIQDEMVVDAEIVSGNLILTKDDGSTIDAGYVVGADGPSDLESVVWVSGHYEGDGVAYLSNASTLAAPSFQASSWIVSPSGVRIYTGDYNINYADVNGEHFFLIDYTGKDTLTFYEPGLCFVSYFISFNSGSAGRRIAMIEINDVEVARTVLGSTSYSAVPVQYYGYVNAGDKVSFTAYQDTGATLPYSISPGGDILVMWMPVYS